MEGNDIGVSYVARYACKFEGLLMHEEEAPELHGVKKLIRKVAPATPRADKVTGLWRPHDMPMRSLLHLCNQLHVNVQVITFMGEGYEDVIETWLARKGAHVEVVSYEDVYEWAEDLRRNPEIKHYYTAEESERDAIGWQHVTVARTSQSWGI